TGQAPPPRHAALEKRSATNANAVAERSRTGRSSGRRDDARQDRAEDVIGRAALDLELRRQHDAMTKHGQRSRLDVVRSDVITGVDRRARACGALKGD